MLLMALAVIVGIVTHIASYYMGFVFWNYISTVIVIVAAVLMLSYEIFLKKKGFVGNITIAVLSGMLFLLGGAVCGNIIPVLPMAAMSIFANLGRELAKDIEDRESDEGRTTLPMKIGDRNASYVAGSTFLIGIGLSILPLLNGSMNVFYSIILVADAMFIYSAFIVFKSAYKAQRTTKYAMLFALLAFVIGVV